MKSKYMIAVFCIICLLSSCYSPENNNNNDLKNFKFDQGAFEAEQKKWEAKNIKDYSFVYSYKNVSTRGPRPLIIKTNVFGGTKSYQEVISGYYEGLPEEIFSDPMKGETSMFDTISEFYIYIYKFAESARANFDSGWYVGVQIPVSYDKKYHYPSSFEFSGWYDADSHITGGGPVFIGITEFKIIDEEAGTASTAD